MDDLIEVLLSGKDLAILQEKGHLREYGFSWIDPDFPGMGNSILPEKYAPLFCNDEERKNFPSFYEQITEDDDRGYDPGRWIYSDAGRRELYRLYTPRYVSNHWTISDGDYLHVFRDKDACLTFLRNRKDFHGYVVRAPDGSERPIQITISLGA